LSIIVAIVRERAQAEFVQIFQKLKTLRAFEKRNLPHLRTVEDHDVVREIGYHEEMKIPLTLKMLFVLDIGSVATVQRRLSRLKRLGVVQQKRAAHDKRNVELTISPAVRGHYRRIGSLITRI
jgi:DNA-binding MarR family transcriptional regulator